ncbi:haloacid dehalogenase [Lentzea sp. NBRC 105346]|uniref:HAD family hydrolase n=1 Tax=Lentzea sp. NBRC 105346 TaxID=3032205 RepID=UPI0024A59127|nr:HAD hydrolase-like protein [Lentzea sp. NBRC 105346]GLZ31205.1 haloacid dehalogenase [Lentzea sp. NBRC 105346]
MRTLVLWDIDRTLVDLSRMGGDWYREALRAVTGLDLVRLPAFGGRTERAITMEILTSHGIEPTEEVVGSLHKSLIEIATREYPQVAVHGRALSGSAEALSALASVSGVVQSVVTGNLAEIARQKLTAFDLHTFVDFEIGGYGSLSAFRPDLVTEALRLATVKHGRGADSVVVIGDTEHDVEAALHHGFTAVAVATGGCTADQLRSAGAHVVLDDLSDTGAVVRAVLQ